MARKKSRKTLPGLGYSPAQKTAPGAGAHGGGKRERNRRERSASRQKIRREWS